MRPKAQKVTQYDPPAPLARVSLRNTSGGQVLRDVPMLLDWGADVTLVPRQAADSVQAPVAAGKTYELEGFEGSRSFAPAARLEIDFAGRTFRGKFLLIDQEWAILGRNVLNSLAILCDGPGLDWEVRAQA
jgi:hypothetical protein